MAHAILQERGAPRCIDGCGIGRDADKVPKDQYFVLLTESIAYNNDSWSFFRHLPCAYTAIASLTEGALGHPAPIARFRRTVAFEIDPTPIERRGNKPTLRRYYFRRQIDHGEGASPCAERADVGT